METLGVPGNHGIWLIFHRLSLICGIVCPDLWLLSWDHNFKLMFTLSTTVRPDQYVVSSILIHYRDSISQSLLQYLDRMLISYLGIIYVSKIRSKTVYKPILISQKLKWDDWQVFNKILLASTQTYFLNLITWSWDLSFTTQYLIINSLDTINYYVVTWINTTIIAVSICCP
jgi:hypothetical protein